MKSLAFYTGFLVNTYRVDASATLITGGHVTVAVGGCRWMRHALSKGTRKATKARTKDRRPAGTWLALALRVRQWKPVMTLKLKLETH